MNETALGIDFKLTFQERGCFGAKVTLSGKMSSSHKKSLLFVSRVVSTARCLISPPRHNWKKVIRRLVLWFRRPHAHAGPPDGRRGSACDAFWVSMLIESGSSLSPGFCFHLFTTFFASSVISNSPSSNLLEHWPHTHTHTREMNKMKQQCWHCNCGWTLTGIFFYRVTRGAVTPQQIQLVLA